MRKDVFCLLALLLAGCQSYEMRRQAQLRDLQAKAAEPATAANAIIQVKATEAPPGPAVPADVANEPAVPASQSAAPPAAGQVEPAEPVVGQNADQVAQLHQRAVARYASIDSYIARLKRIEEVNGKVRPEELVLFKFRKEPWSIYFKWIGPEGKGREAVYVKGRYDDKLYTLLAAGDSLLMPAGKVMALDPFGYLVRSNSRYTINQAGIGAMIDRFGALVREQPSHLSYQGLVRKPEQLTPLHEVLQSIPAGQDPLLPKGGSRMWSFDSQTGLPVMLKTWNADRQLVEMYAYDQILYPVKLDDNDFDPNVIWKKKE